MKVGFIGVGNMARAIIAGWQQQQTVMPKDIYVHSAHKESYQPYAAKLGLNACVSNQEVVKQTDILFLAIKPIVLKDVLLEIKDVVKQKKPVVVSMVTGVSLAEIKSVLASDELEILRIMPNVNVEIAAGMTALVGNDKLSATNYQKCQELLASIGQTVELPEKDFSTFVALAGSSPAYVYFYIDAMARAGVKYGLTKKEATKISAQAVLGSAKKVLASSKTPMELVDDVCSPGGTTIAGLLAMQEAGFMTAVVKGIDATIAKDQSVQTK